MGCMKCKEIAKYIKHQNCSVAVIRLFIYCAEGVDLATSAVIRDDFIAVDTCYNGADFGHVDRNCCSCGILKYWPGGDNRWSFGTFRVSFPTVAGSSDTWGYTWRRHNADCVQQGSKGHWMFKNSGCASYRAGADTYSWGWLILCVNSLNNREFEVTATIFISVVIFLLRCLLQFYCLLSLWVFILSWHFLLRSGF
jgi:hypothetical protein